MRLPRGIAAACGAALAAAALFAAAPARALFDDDIARARIEELRKRVEATAKEVEERLGRLEDRRSLVELSGQLEQLRSEIARLRGSLELLQNQIETADKRGKDLYVDIDSRLRKLEQAKEKEPEKPAAGSDRKSTRLNSSHIQKSRMPSSA